MTTWADLSRIEPDLAARGRSILASTTNAVLATLRADGSPRVSGIDPFFAVGELWIGSMPGARKADDLARDPRLALHGIPWESRRCKDGAADPGEADVKLTGRAIEVTDPVQISRALASFATERGFEPPEVGHYYRIELEGLALTFVEGEELVIDHWTERSGRSTTRRT